MSRNDEIDLTQFDDAYAAAPVDERQFGEIPDGKYRVVVDRVEITTARTSGNAMLKWRLKILDGQFKNRLLFRNSVLSSPQMIAWLKSDLHLCGVDLEKLSDLPGALERLLDIELEVTKRTRGDFENIYFNTRTDGRTSPSLRGSGSGDDDIAF